ncbi:glycosyltransferase family 2 protein [Polynucleobacter sp. AP-Kaivos-20-H2]|uniref:glycosyltransferase family 2 protein n=1 Tax=Polynucleobacter sp. AP-Kaivos-20-H2 TaxID=2689104 RepID=UPI001C0E6853|nr:glycosyltransferase family A protein [Polynucleobacter sp. AP-Kaivos-20-H2]MBU3604141.1 hypothetical protein [Polynucleobacter sp. AP-Kaivos-20-H2]
MKAENSIFKEYYRHHEFVDRYLIDDNFSVTVIIPVIHTNELWRANLLSIYREIPVKELLIGDGGCIDDSILIAQEFPRVQILDQRSYKTLGYSIKNLIQAVNTEWFIYLHSDVYLPVGWFDKMKPFSKEYDWFGCRMQQTVMIEYDNDYGERPYAGSQVGRKAAFIDGLRNLDDDFIYRQEDFVFSDVVEKAGFKEGKIDLVFHYHQTISKSSSVWNPRGIKVNISQTLPIEEEVRMWDSQVKGIIKYLQPNCGWTIENAIYGVFRLEELGHCSSSTFYDWANSINPQWVPFLKRGISAKKRERFLAKALSAIKRTVKAIAQINLGVIKN